MEFFKKFFCLLLALSMMLSRAACGQTAADTPTEPAASAAYSVCVCSQGGMALSGIDVYIYEGEDLAGFGQTDETGSFTVTLPQKDSYRIVLDQVPQGYSFQESYSFQDAGANHRG